MQSPQSTKEGTKLMRTFIQSLELKQKSQVVREAGGVLAEVLPKTKVFFEGFPISKLIYGQSHTLTGPVTKSNLIHF